MKSKLKIITAFIIGVIVSGITVYAASKIYSNQVEIDKTGGKLANVNGTKLQDALDYLYEKASKVGTCPEMLTKVSDLQVGYLVKMIPTETSVRLDGTKTGYAEYNTTETYINPSELQYWRVIKKNDDGTVDVVSEYASSVDVYFSGIVGYKNYISYLNELASHYENNLYTIGSRHMGYDSTKATEILTSTTKYSSGSSAPWPNSTTYQPSSSNEQIGAGDMGYQTDYSLVVNAYKNIKIDGASIAAKTYKVGTTTPTQYWLASRYYHNHNSTYFHFHGRHVNTNGQSDTGYAFRGYFTDTWKNSSHRLALRPILVLRSTAYSSQIESSTGAYILD